MLFRHILFFGVAERPLARAASLTPERRKEISEKALKAKAEISALPKAEYSGELRLGDLVLPAAVLSDGTRVLTETDFMEGLKMYRSGALSVRRKEDTETGAQTPLYLAFKNLKPFIDKHLPDVHDWALKYRTEKGNIAHGIKAELIPKICDVWLDADAEGILGPRQKQVAANALILMRGLAHVGIIALVDEATGYQKSRAKNELAKILEAFIAKELQPYVRTFEMEFYENMFRLRGLPFPNGTVKRPQYFGHLTNDIIYNRLAPGVLKELKEKTAKNEKGRLKHKLFQKLTPDFGHPKLRDLLVSVTTIMKLSNKWR